jgi:hypothetical protein
MATNLRAGTVCFSMHVEGSLCSCHSEGYMRGHLTKAAADVGLAGA